MLIVLALITLLITIWFLKLADDEPYEMWDAGAVLSGVIFVICIMAMFWTGYHVHRCVYVIPAQIAMYEEENTKIEEKVRDTVNKYMEYEGGVIMEIAPEDDAMSLISLYPDLKTDQLISEEISVYIANNDQIKKLRAELAEQASYKWWLYFGH
jgi:hypothetical protein